MTIVFAEETEASQAESTEALALQIADEACRVDIECHALCVPSDYPARVYDVTQLEPDHLNDEEIMASDQQAIDRAVRYLDLRQLLVRPMPSQPQYVAFVREV